MHSIQDERFYESASDLLEQLSKDKQMFRTLLLNRLEANTAIEYAQKEGEVLKKLEEWVEL